MQYFVIKYLFPYIHKAKGNDAVSVGIKYIPQRVRGR